MDLTCCWWVLFPGMLLGLGLSWLLGSLLGRSGHGGGGSVSLNTEIRNAVKESLKTEVSSAVRESLKIEVSSSVKESLKTEVSSAVKECLVTEVGGNAKNRSADGYSPPETKASGVKSFDVQSAVKHGIEISGPENIEIIEGIGPKIALIFRQNNLGTLHAIAASSEEHMHDLLARNEIKVANTPGTWALQAQLLVSHRWKDFIAYTDFLKDGRVPKN